MLMRKKIALIFSAVLILATVSASVGPSYASVTPTLSMTTNNNNDSVQLSISGDANAGVVLYYTKTNVGQQVSSLGTTNSSGQLTATVSTSEYGIASGSSVYITVGGINGARSATVAWPVSTTTGTFSLSQTSVVMTVGQTTSISVQNNTTGSVYLSNNSNPPVANVNINGNQVSITALGYGSTVVMLCAQSSSTKCASAYVAVQNGSVQALSFSISNVTVSPNQNVPITISGGTGVYTVLSNSNSTAIQTSISSSIITLTANSTTGTAAITVCSSDMSSCGIINATAGSASTVPLTFSQTSPTLSIGQSLTLAISGGSSSTYYVSANTNTSAVQTSISSGSLLLTGLASGTATITVCSSAGSCGSLTATVGYTSDGGPFKLNQTSISLLVGQVLSVTASGGTTPYSLGYNSGNVFQASLNGNVVTLSGIAVGSSTLTVCTAGGACALLSVTVNASGSGTPMSFSQNSVSLNVGGAAAVTITGGGGYYVSNSTSQNIASVQISGSIAIISALAGGSTNVSICQSGGQCSILFISVSASSGAASLPTFSQTSPVVSVSQTASVALSGGASNSYYITGNSNPNALLPSINGTTLTLTGQTAGSATVVVCAASNSCSPLTVTVNAVAGTPPTFNPGSLSLTVGQTQTAAISGNGGYTLSNNTNNSVATVQISGSTITVSAVSQGTSSASICQSGGQCATFSISVSSAASNPASSTPGQPSNTLINDHGAIFLIVGQTKIPFASMKAFSGLGYSLTNVVKGDASGYQLNSTVLKSPTQAHPDGTWIQSGKVVFYVAATGYIPVPTWSIFLSNGGNAKFIVKANASDLKDPRPIIAAMTVNDSRVGK